MNTIEESNHYNKPRLLGVTDVVIIIALIIASVIFIPFLRSHQLDTVEIYKVDDIIARYPLGEDRVFSVKGIDGTLEVEIKDRRVRVHSSSCPQQICVDTGWISETYEQIVCAPNLVFIIVKADSEKEQIDVLTH